MQEIGIEHAEAQDVYFGVDSHATFPIMAKQHPSGMAPLGPFDVKSQITKLQEYGEKRKIVVILEGDAAWMSQFRSAVEPTGPAAIIYCAPATVLDQLGIAPADAGWSSDDSSLDIEELLSAGGRQRRVARPTITPSAKWGGYFSQPKDQLDERIFVGDHLRDDVRLFSLEELYTFWQSRYASAKDWSRCWIAGSAVCYQYSEENADLDVLIGVDMETFHQANPQYADKTEAEMIEQWNHEFNAELEPTTKDFEGFHVTFFVNPASWDIRVINPYAAYSLTYDDWTVPPIEVPVPWDPFEYFGPEATAHVYDVLDGIKDLVRRYNMAKDRGDRADRVHVVQEASDIFEKLYSDRQRAYTPGGEGYFDPLNFQWQVLEAEGALPAIWEIKNFGDRPTPKQQWYEELQPGDMPLSMDPRQKGGKPSLPKHPDVAVKSMAMAAGVTTRRGGDARGSAEDRRRRKIWMLNEFGDGNTVGCVHCAALLTFLTVTADRIKPGGPYRRDNVQPACLPCNMARYTNKDWVPAPEYLAARDKHPEDYGLTYDVDVVNRRDVQWGLQYKGWDAVPVRDVKISGTIYATEAMLDARPIERVVNGAEPLREGYYPHVLYATDGSLVVIDGHHRFAMASGMGVDTLQCRVLDAALPDWGVPDADDTAEAS